MTVGKRVQTIFTNLEVKPDAILIKNAAEPYIDDNFFYVTGLEHGLFEGAVALLFPDGKIELIVSELESETAKNADAQLHIYRNKEDADDLLKDALSSVQTIGINSDGILHRTFCKLKENLPGVEFRDVSDAFAKARLVKDEIEIVRIKEACKIADHVMKKIPDLVHDGIYEYELAAEINYLMQKKGADKPAFDTISSFGKNTAEPHYTHGDVTLKKGDLVLCDFGACLRKYNSDTTRTFVFGTANEQQKAIYETVLKAQQIGFDTAKAGVTAHEVHDAVNAYIDSTQFNGRFIHSTGHSLGIAVHDGGVGFSPECNVELQENMVLTVEPGVYIPGFGGVRIEDDVIIKKDGIELLTTSSRTFIEI